MKRNILFLLSVMLLSSFQLMAQLGQPWVVGGNNLSANRAFGANNNWDVFFETNNLVRGRVTRDGLWNFGPGTPNPYRVRVSHDNWGLDIQNSGSLDNWELWTGGSLQLYFNGSFRGSFNTSTGAYTPASDERLKTNIQPMERTLEKINQLKPSTYQFKNRGAEIYNGFIAQDVMKIFPNLVTHNINKERNIDVYTLDYGAIGVIAIKGIQELEQTISDQQKTINDQQKTINTLLERVTKLEASLAISNNASSENMKSGLLLQNQPNPFSQVTNIRYNIPQGADAQIRIYDAAGNMVKTMRATESGQVQINAYELKAGTYTYTLVVNGNATASKKMVLLK